MSATKGQLTPRDLLLIEFCLNHLPITSDIAAVLFYPNKYIAQRRLTTIHQLKQLKRSERLIMNQPYCYYKNKSDLKNIIFSQLLYDLTLHDYKIEQYTFEENTLTAIVHQSSNSFQINATRNNLQQVYHRLSLNEKVANV